MKFDIKDYIEYEYDISYESEDEYEGFKNVKIKGTEESYAAIWFDNCEYSKKGSIDFYVLKDGRILEDYEFSLTVEEFLNTYFN